MKILIVGASGLVGFNCYNALTSAGHHVVGTCFRHPRAGLIPLDLGDHAAVREVLKATRPDVVICATAWSFVDGCQADPKRAFRENTEQPELLANLATVEAARMVHFSTSYIFDGTAGPYSEDAAPNPISIYGESKLAGERKVQEATRGEAIIVRTMGVYGSDPQAKNFVSQVRRNLSSGERMRVPCDQLGNASYAPDIAEALLQLMVTGRTGIWNVAGPEPALPRSEVARRVARYYGLDESLFDFPTTAELTGLAPRPLHGGLRTDKARLQLDWEPRSLEAGLASMDDLG
jgi:dTDP-4-dehydrorhamnose reductase